MVDTRPGEKDRTGPREGGSRTYDADGNLLSVNGKTVAGTETSGRKKKPARSAGGND